MSSGNLLADRRMEFARDIHARGDTADAIDILFQAIELAPDWADGHFLVGEWLAEAGRRDEAVLAYRNCLAIDADDRLGAIVRLALLGAVATPPAMPSAYIAGLFDDYAARFDRALVESLEYRVAGDLHALVATSARLAHSLGRVLDLGCGTGLAGERFRRDCAWLEGVDLSDGMIAQARNKGFYDRLVVGDALAFLSAGTPGYDLIVAADTLIYFGDLTPVIAAATGALVPGGRLAFSVEAADGDAYILTAAHRYAHSEPYLRRTLEAAGLTIDAISETTCRLEAGAPVRGYLVVCRRPGSTPIPSVGPASPSVIEVRRLDS